MNLENIHEGDIFKNYKELCAALGITTMGGNTKKSNLKKLAQHCEYEINGREFRIKKIYESPLLQTNQNQGGRRERYLFAPAIQQILLFELTQHNINTTYEQLYKMLWFVNNNYSNLEARNNFLKEHPNISSEDINDIKQRIVIKTKSLITYSLKTLEEKGAITYHTQYYVTTKEGEHRLATEEEKNLYNRLESTLLYNYFKCKNIREIFSKGLSIEYYNRLSNDLLTNGIKEMKLHICISTTGKYVSLLSEKEITGLKRHINKDMRRFIRSQLAKENSAELIRILQSKAHLCDPSFNTLYSELKTEELETAEAITHFLIAKAI